MSEQSETPILDLLARMSADSIEASSLDDRTMMLVRIAALVAVDAPPASYLLNLGAAGDVGVDEEEVRGVLAAVAPVVGTPRVAAAAENLARALGFALDSAGGRARGPGLTRLRIAGELSQRHPGERMLPDRSGDRVGPLRACVCKRSSRTAAQLNPTREVAIEHLRRTGSRFGEADPRL